MEQDLIFYSVTLGGFLFDSDRKAYESGIGWPADAVEITSENYVSLLDSQTAGMVITADANGYPVATPLEQAEPTLQAQQRQLLKEAENVTQVWRTELTMGSISDEDKEKLEAWGQYYRDVKAVDVSAPGATFPPTPEI